MKVQRVQNNNYNTNFGTRFGKNLTQFIETNKEIISNNAFTNLARIRNNGINSVLELEKASVKEQKAGNKYNLNLSGGIFDRVNYYMNWGGQMHAGFKKQLANSDKVKKSVFPISIKNEEGSTPRLVLKQFDSVNQLEEKIENEYSQSKIIEEKFKNFEENWNKKFE